MQHQSRATKVAQERSQACLRVFVLLAVVLAGVGLAPAARADPDYQEAWEDISHRWSGKPRESQLVDVRSGVCRALLTGPGYAPVKGVAAHARIECDPPVNVEVDPHRDEPYDWDGMSATVVVAKEGGGVVAAEHAEEQAGGVPGGGYVGGLDVPEATTEGKCTPGRYRASLVIDHARWAVSGLVGGAREDTDHVIIGPWADISC